ncbi:TetR/AcrR family transcriptional regulator [Mycobacterium paraense]|uniref:TetR/AcrR family transcriptional regulator n=1 Tax=Mycobacterium paraense TaxID=767916 RepID=UPI000A1690D9|nr:TetR/AcrR family transcriptional regulator [Mycobacterium paraense]
MKPRRLKPQQRCEQLLDTGAALFAEKPYEDVLVEEIAARAGVSRATLYHYYPSKRDLYLAILKRSSDRFLARMGPDPQLPLAEQLATGLEVHIDSLVAHPFEAVAINRGALSDDPEIQAIIAEELSIVGKLLTDRLVAEGCLRDSTEIAVEGWLAFVRASCVKWIQSQNISRSDLTELCLRAFECALDISTPTSRWRARMHGVMQSQATASLIRKSQRATTARGSRAPVGHYATRLGALLTARSLLKNEKAP